MVVFIVFYVKLVVLEPSCELTVFLSMFKFAVTITVSILLVEVANFGRGIVLDICVGLLVKPICYFSLPYSKLASATEDAIECYDAHGSESTPSTDLLRVVVVVKAGIFVEGGVTILVVLSVMVEALVIPLLLLL